MKSRSYTITKRIAKHGNQAIIVIPNILAEQIKPQMLVKVIIEVLEENGGRK